MRRSPLPFLVVLLATLVLAACHKDKQEKLVEAGASPQVAVETALQDVRQGQLDDLYRHLLPPADYQDLRDSWARRHAAAEGKVSAKERKQFADLMQAWTAPDAKKTQFAKLEPKLDAWETDGKRQLPMLVGVMRMMAGSQITRSKTLEPAQKTQLRHLVEALAGWINDTDWGDKAHARKAVGVLVDTARALDIRTLDDVYALDYDGAMDRYATAWEGARKLLDIYGLSLDQVLDSAKVDVLDQQADKATVKVTWNVLDQPMQGTLEMVRKGKRWYAVDALTWWHGQQQKLAAAASSAATPGSTAPAGSVAAPGSAAVAGSAPAASAAPASSAGR